MSTKRERSNRDPDDSKRQGANSANEPQTRKGHKSSDADKIQGKTGDKDRETLHSHDSPTD